MLQTLNLHTDEPRQPPTLAYLRTIRTIHDPETLEGRHREVSAELASRSSAPETRANSELSDASVEELQQILETIFHQAMLLLSRVRDSYNEIRYVDQCLDRGPRSLFELSSARHAALIQHEAEDLERERMQEDDYESEILGHVNTPTIDYRDEEY
jgi:hypothetical protein